LANSGNIKILKSKLKFTLLAILAIILTILLANYVSSILFDGKNSLKVYNALIQQKSYLQKNILQLQLSNARLQKEYFELKNLEPEE
jgi:cell division protein FtsX